MSTDHDFIEHGTHAILPVFEDGCWEYEIWRDGWQVYSVKTLEEAIEWIDWRESRMVD